MSLLKNGTDGLGFQDHFLVDCKDCRKRTFGDYNSNYKSQTTTCLIF